MTPYFLSHHFILLAWFLNVTPQLSLIGLLSLLLPLLLSLVPKGLNKKKKERREIRVGESLRIGMLSSPSTSGKTYEDPCPIQTRRDKRINLLQVGLVYE